MLRAKWIPVVALGLTVVAGVVGPTAGVRADAAPALDRPASVCVSSPTPIVDPLPYGIPFWIKGVNRWAVTGGTCTTVTVPVGTTST